MSWLIRGFLCFVAIQVLFQEGQAGAKSINDSERILKVTVLFFDFVHVPEKVRQLARERVGKIYQKVGVQLIWADCPTVEGTMSLYSNCTGFKDETHLFLRILPQARCGLQLEAAGETIHGPRIINVFWDRAREQAVNYRVPLQEMLAQIMAHEIGHILLGPNSHAPSGIMIARCKAKNLIEISQGRYGFSPEQSQRIQSEVRKRQTLQEQIISPPDTVQSERAKSNDH
jgi:hypothetical protein